MKTDHILGQYDVLSVSSKIYFLILFSVLFSLFALLELYLILYIVFCFWFCLFVFLGGGFIIGWDWWFCLQVLKVFIETSCFLISAEMLRGSKVWTPIN